MFLGHRRRHDVGAVLELFTKGLGQIRHLVEILHAALVHPAKQLGRAKRLFPKLATECGERVAVQVEEIGDHDIAPAGA